MRLALLAVDFLAGDEDSGKGGFHVLAEAVPGRRQAVQMEIVASAFRALADPSRELQQAVGRDCQNHCVKRMVTVV